MNTSEMKCKSCEGYSFVQAMDFVNLRPMDLKLKGFIEESFVGMAYLTKPYSRKQRTS